MTTIPCHIRTDCRIIGCDISEFASVGSTNATARSMALDSAREGTVVIAAEQTEGRGRHGRTWISPPGGLYLSIVLRPPKDVGFVSAIPLIAGLAVSKAISTSAGLVTSLKWPNDVLIGERKVCGILSESSYKGDVLDFIVVGIGINVEAFDMDLPDANVKATSLKEEGADVELSCLASDLLYIMDMLYGRFLNGQADPLLGEWTDRSSTIGRDVSVLTSSGEVKGTAIGLDRSGALILRQGTRLTMVQSGDCLHLKA